MRILIVFIDMLRPDLCRTFEPSAKAGPMDGFFSKLGGTVFRRAFTPAPVTSRSLACFWSGRYPAQTGCTKISRWPQDFMADDLPTLFSTFDRAGFSLHAFLNRNEKAFGLLPGTWQQKVQLNDGYDLEMFLRSVPKRDRQVIFVSLIDVHWFMTDHGYTLENFVASQALPARALARAGEAHPLEEFDEIVAFSDHGFQEGQWFDCPWQQRLAREKTAIALAWRSKAQPGSRQDDKLRTIMDVFPTLAERAGLPAIETDGMSLLSPSGHDYVVHEDTLDLAAVAGPRAAVDMWGLTFPDGYFAFHDGQVHLTSQKQTALFRTLGPERFTEKIFAVIGKHSPSMEEYAKELASNRRQHAMIAAFRADGGYPDPIFADGTPVEQWESVLHELRRSP